MKGKWVEVKIENDRDLALALRNLRILNAELAGFGIPRDKVTQAMRASLEGQIISIQQDIEAYNHWKNYMKEFELE